MKWSLLELKKHQDTPVTFDETFELKAELMSRDSQILDVAPVNVSGLLSVSKNDYLVHYTIKTVLTLPSSRSLEPVPLTLDFSVDELFMTQEQFDNRAELIGEEEVLIIEGQTIDLKESVVDNILLAIPLQILSEEEINSPELPSGNDWVVISEEDYLAQQEAAEENNIDPRLAKLSELLKDDPSDEA